MGGGNLYFHPFFEAVKTFYIKIIIKKQSVGSKDQATAVRGLFSVLKV